MSEPKKGQIVEPSSFDAPVEPQSETGFRWGWKQSIAAVAVLFVASLLAFMISARALLIIPNAVDSQISLSGGTHISLGAGRFLLLKGEYQLEVSARGYHPFTQPVIVNSDTPPSLSIDLEPLPGRVRAFFAMEENVSGIFRLNGTGIGPAREFLFKDLDAGDYSLSADAFLYAPAEVQINVRGRELTEEIPVVLEPNWGYLAIHVEPASAELYAGNQILEATESGYRVEAGTSKLSVKAEGYKNWETQIEILKNQVLDLDKLSLEPVDSQIQLVTLPADVSVTLNGSYLGQTPLTLDLLPEADHQLQLFKAGFQTQSHLLNVQRNAEEMLEYKMAADMVEVNISVSPRNADIFIDGAKRGTGTQKISLAAVKHNIRVEAAGYETQSVEFLPVRGSRQLLQMHLMTEEQALWANTPPEYTGSAGHKMLLFRDAGIVPMGSSRREPGRRANEVQWTARLDRAFYVSTTETTNSQYRLFESEHTSGHYESMGLDGPERPAVGMSWQKAALFCNWLSEKSGLEPFYQTTRGFVSGVNPDATGYRLLTESEWTYLAKITPAGIPQKYSWGDEDSFQTPPDNFADQSISEHINFILEGVNDGYPVSSPVGSFPANSRGIHDLGGNVMEWVHDWYQPVPYDNNKEAVDPLGPDEGEFHVIRGASWARGYLPQLRLAYRDYDSTGRNDLGFRIARYAM